MSGENGSGERHPTLAELLDGAIRTLEQVLLPALETPWAMSSAIGLAGQLRYARMRVDDDSLAAQDAALERCLAELCEGFPELRAVVEATPVRGDRSWDLRERAGRLLAFAACDDDARPGGRPPGSPEALPASDPGARGPSDRSPDAARLRAVQAVRQRLRPLLLEHLQQDLAASAPMLKSFLAAGSVGSAR